MSISATTTGLSCGGDTTAGFRYLGLKGSVI